MVNCAVLSCKNDSRRQTKQNSNVTFHRFPKREDLLSKWVDALQRPNWEPTIRSFVCSAHFAPSSMFLSKRGLRKLVPHAVPEIFKEEPKSKKHKKKSNRVVTPYMYESGQNIKDSSNIKTEVVKKDVFSLNGKDLNQQKMKKRIMNVAKLAKRRRLRCNALYAGLNRIKKKVTAVTQVMRDLHENTLLNEELSMALESCGISTKNLLKRLCKREKEDIDETDEFSDSESPNDIDNFVEQDAPQTKTLVYTMCVPAELDDDGTKISDKEKSEDSIVKTERAGFEGAGTELGDCRVCLASNVQVYNIASDLKNIYQTLTNTQLESSCGVPDTLCAACDARLVACARFADMARKAESYYQHKGNDTTEQPRDPVDVKIEAVSFGIQPVNAWPVNVAHIADDSDG